MWVSLPREELLLERLLGTTWATRRTKNARSRSTRNRWRSNNSSAMFSPVRILFTAWFHRSASSPSSCDRRRDLERCLRSDLRCHRTGTIARSRLGSFEGQTVNLLLLVQFPQQILIYSSFPCRHRVSLSLSILIVFSCWICEKCNKTVFLPLGLFLCMCWKRMSSQNDVDAESVFSL